MYNDDYSIDFNEYNLNYKRNDRTTCSIFILISKSFSSNHFVYIEKALLIRDLKYVSKKKHLKVKRKIVSKNMDAFFKLIFLSFVTKKLYDIVDYIIMMVTNVFLQQMIWIFHVFFE